MGKAESKLPLRGRREIKISARSPKIQTVQPAPHVRGGEKSSAGVIGEMYKKHQTVTDSSEKESQITRVRYSFS